MQTIWLEASAGSGKTTFLLSQIKETDADKVMFITFSNTAANEIKHRAGSKIYSTTLHALAYKIILNKLNKNISPESLRYQAVLTMLENEEFYQLVSWLLNENITLDENIQQTTKPNDLNEEEAPNKLNYEWENDLSHANIIPDFKLTQIKLIFFTKQNEKRKKMPMDMNLEYVEWAIARIKEHENYIKNYAHWIQGKINSLIKQQEEQLKEFNNVIYYEDLIIHAINILKKQENADLLFKYFGNIKILLIDEAQDLSKTQWELLIVILSEWQALGNNLIIASDPKQLIYNFQGACLTSFLKAKEDIKKLSNKFEIKKLNHTFRLPKKICEFLNKVGNKLEINFVQHSTQSQKDGWVEFIFIDDINEIINIIKNFDSKNVMILFKQKTERMEKLSQALFANGFILNSPFACLHPVIKDFQHLINWILSDNKFSLYLIQKVIPDINELSKLKNFNNLSDICARWIMNKNTQSFLQQKLGNAKAYWENVLLEYAVFYEHEFYNAITDTHNFFKSHCESKKTDESKKNIFQQGLFFNTIHSAKGMEADIVLLLETDFKSKFKNDTHRLLYVGLTRAKEKLIIPVFRKNLDNLDNTWAQILIESFNE